MVAGDAAPASRARLVAAQRRWSQTLLANGRQAIDIRELPRRAQNSGQGRLRRRGPHHARPSRGGPRAALIALHRFPKIGHMPHFEARREVARLIEELARAGTPE